MARSRSGSQRGWRTWTRFDFLEDDDNIDLQTPTIEMIIDFRDNKLVDDYFEV